MGILDFGLDFTFYFPCVSPLFDIENNMYNLII